jgi:hypothetical protein
VLKKELSRPFKKLEVGTMAYSIFNARGSRIEEPRAELFSRFKEAAMFISHAESKEGFFLLEENVSVIKNGELANGLVVFCALSQPDHGVSIDADFFAKECLLFYTVELPSGIAGESISLRFLGTSHDVASLPDWVGKSVIMKTQQVYLSVARDSNLDKLVMNLAPDSHDAKRQRGENNSSNSKSSGDDTKTVIDKDGVVHPSSNPKRDVDRIKLWTPLMRLVSDDFRTMYMGNDGIPEMNVTDILQRLDVTRSVAINKIDSDPLKSVASIDNIAHLEAVKDEKKTYNLLMFDVRRTQPLGLCLQDFYDGVRSEVFPPSITALCDQLAVERVARMFSGLERSLVALCDPLYRGVFASFRDKLSQPTFVGRRHTVAFVLDVLQSPLFALSIRLREDKALDGSLRGPAKVRALLISAYEALVIPNYDGDWQSREFDYMQSTHKRITWSGVPTSPAASIQPAGTILDQAELSRSQMKRLLKRTQKAPASTPHAPSIPGGASSAGGGPAVPPLVQPFAVTQNQGSATKTGQGLCLRNLAQMLGMQGQACTAHPCKFGHEALKATSKVGALAAIDKLKSFPTGIDKVDMLARIAASTLMAK